MELRTGELERANKVLMAEKRGRRKGICDGDGEDFAVIMMLLNAKRYVRLIFCPIYVTRR